MNEIPEILNELRALHEKLDRILTILDSSELRPKPLPSKPPKPKLLPPTQEEIESNRARFESLYEKWLSGNEAEVQAELENIDSDGIRRFADANNLNVTSKMPKQKVLHLIAARFREKKQLLRNTPLSQRNADPVSRKNADNDDSE